MSLTWLCNWLVVSRLTDDMGPRVQEKLLPNGSGERREGGGKTVEGVRSTSTSHVRMSQGRGSGWSVKK
jgi:hypothetical protein